MANYKLIWAVFLFCTLFSINGWAAQSYKPQPTNPLLEEWRWTYHNQFSGKAINCMAQAPNGDLWLGGNDQIIRYDGMDTTIYKFEGQDADNLFIASNGDVYARFINQLWRFRGNGWEHLALIDSMSNINYGKNIMMEMPDQSIWVCSNYGIFRIQNDTFSLIRFDREYIIDEKFNFRSFDVIDVRAIYRIRQGKLFAVIAGQGLFEILENHSGYVIGQKIATLSTSGIIHIHQTRDGNLWILNDNISNPIVIINLETYHIKEINFNQYGQSNDCFSIVELDDGSIWISGHSKIAIYKDDVWTFYSAQELNLPIAMTKLYMDASRRLWVCAIHNDVYSIMLPGKRFYTFKDLHFQGQTADSTEWFIVKDGGIVSHKPDTDNWTYFDDNDNIIDTPTGLKVAGNDYIYVFGSHKTSAAVAYFDGDKWVRYVNPDLGLLVAYNGCAETSDGKMWFGSGGNPNWTPGTKGGLMSFDPVQKKWRHHDFGEEYYRNTSMAGAPDGLLWIGCPNITRTYDGENISFIPISASPSAWTDDLIVTPQNKIWLVKSGLGTFEVNGQSWINYTTENGMISNKPTCLYYSSQGMLWVGAEDGICCYDGQNWIANTFISQFNVPRESGTIRDSRDGAIWINLSERDWYFRAQFSNQNQNNVKKDYVFKTIRCQVDTACPRTEFTAIETSVAHGGKAFFSWKAKDYWNVTPEEHLQFSYKLDDATWSLFSHETNVIFETLTHGRHVLQVCARDADLNMDPSPPRVEFLVDQAFWKQTWVIILIIFIILTILFLIQRLIQRGIDLSNSNKQLKHRSEDLKIAKETAEAAKEAADTANRFKSEFLANMSHEIRTPMNGVIGMTELALDLAADKQLKEFLNISKQSAESLLDLLNDILDFSKIEAGKLDLEELDFNLRDVIETAISTLAIHAHSKGLELLCDIHPEVSAYLKGDPGRLKQIVVNLIGNAIKFTEKGEIVVRVEPVNQSGNDDKNRIGLHFQVIDTGIGIAQDKLDQIFRSFSQEDNSTTRKYGGTGLGLTIAQRLSELMGGKIWVTSEKGNGSAFQFTAYFKQGEPVAEDELRLENIDFNHVRVLIVDDNHTNCMILESVMKNWGFDVTYCHYGKEALAALYEATVEERNFTLILLDYQMPEMDGLAFAEKVRANDKWNDIKIIMLSSISDSSDLRRLKKIGIDDYLIKPIRQADLLQTLMSTFGKSTLDDNVTDMQSRVMEETPQLRILLAEDNIINQKVAVNLLKKWGHEIIVANDGKEAVKFIMEQDFDLVLMDIQMPNMDGLEATRAIRNASSPKVNSEIPIIALTAHTMKGDKERFLEAGMDDYISKPINAGELRKLIFKYIPLQKNVS